MKKYVHLECYHKSFTGNYLLPYHIELLNHIADLINGYIELNKEVPEHFLNEYHKLFYTASLI